MLTEADLLYFTGYERNDADGSTRYSGEYAGA
jgi:hypothetical protein